VIGIVAGRLKEKLHKPAIVVALDADGTGKGSGRSISGVDLGAAVLAAKDEGLLVAGGGHAMAAGLTIAPGQVEAVADFLETRLAADVARSRDDRALLLDAVLAPRGICPDLCDALDAGGPYGAGWPSPRVAAGPVAIVKADVVGNGHLRLVVAGDDGRRIKAIAFRMADSALGQAMLAAPAHRKLWLAGRMKRDEYNGNISAELLLDDAAWAD
jgi:single-stranded-DNA-specific exonuclease